MNKSIGSLLFLPSTSPSLFPSFHPNKYQRSSLEAKKKKVTKTSTLTNTGICVNKVNQSPPFCFGDTWKAIFEITVYVASLLQQHFKVKLCFLLLILNSDPPFQLSKRKPNLDQYDPTQTQFKSHYIFNCFCTLTHLTLSKAWRIQGVGYLYFSILDMVLFTSSLIQGRLAL